MACIVAALPPIKDLSSTAQVIIGLAMAVTGVLVLLLKSRRPMSALLRSPGPHPPVPGPNPAMLAHEIRNPLTAALGRLDLMLEDPSLQPHQATSVQTALRGVERACAVISDFMADPDGWQSGRALGDLEPVDLRLLVHDAMQEYASLAAERRVSMSLDVQGDVTVSGDGLRLRQLFDNLLSNAVKYNEDQGWIDIRLGEAPPSSDGRAYVLVEITNPGTTLTTEDSDAVFDERFRGRSVPEGVPGEGFGLTVVRSIVQAHGGTITLTSDNVSRATQIDVTLPASAEKRQQS